MRNFSNRVFHDIRVKKLLQKQKAATLEPVIIFFLIKDWNESMKLPSIRQKGWGEKQIITCI